MSQRMRIRIRLVVFRPLAWSDALIEDRALDNCGIGRWSRCARLPVSNAWFRIACRGACAAADTAAAIEVRVEVKVVCVLGDPAAVNRAGTHVPHRAVDQV